ncbi:MAG TPA: chemotaxis protein CheW [Trichocoleus sp.]
MNDRPYLIFELHSRPYGIAAHSVQEIFLLPEIHSMAGAPAAVVGVLNLRGTLLPVVDLSQRLGLGPHPFAVNDSIIVLIHRGQKVAVVVSQVFDVVQLAANPAPSPTSDDAQTQTVVVGMTQWGNEVITLLDAAALVKMGQAGTASNRQSVEEASSAQFFTSTTAADRQRLQERAEHLRQPVVEERFHEQIPLAVVGMQGEQFALPVEYIREFTPVRAVTPIPCCPAHVIGNMNLRGEILTLIDVRPVLQLKGQAQSASTQAVVVQLDDLIAGITVDAVFDVMYVQPAAIAPIPVASYSLHEEYLRGVVSGQSDSISLLDLNKLLTSSELVVNEAA